MESNDEFFRTLISLENGERMYETVNGKIVCRRAERRRGVEIIQRAMLARENVAFAPKLMALRPAWAFPTDIEIHPVTRFINEPADEPLDMTAHLISGEAISDSTPFIYLS